MPLPWVDLGHAGPLYTPAFRWPLDDAAGSFRDLGGRGGKVPGVANGTILRNPVVGPGWLPGCVQMSTNGWINIWGTEMNFLLTPYAFSISAWIRRIADIPNGSMHVISAGGDWAWNLMVGQNGAIPYSGANTVSFGYVNANGNWDNIVDNQPIPLNTWWFVMGTIDGYRHGLERNGFDVASNSGITLPKRPTSAAIGCYPDGTSWRATGLQIADVRIYPYRLVETEARAIYQSYATPPAYPWISGGEPHSLILYLPGDQPGSRNVRDAAGNPVGGNFGGGSPGQAGPMPGMKAFALNGSSDYMAMKGSNALNNVTNVWTLSAWVYLTATRTTFTGAITKNHTQGGNCLPVLGYAHESIGQPTNRFSTSIWNGSAWMGCADPVDAPLNTWVHIAGTYDGATMRFYRNGVLVNTTVGASAPAATANDWLIGKRWDGTGYWPGSLSDVRVYNQALDAAAIKGIYDRAAGVARPWVPLGVVT